MEVFLSIFLDQYISERWLIKPFVNQILQNAFLQMSGLQKQWRMDP